MLGYVLLHRNHVRAGPIGPNFKSQADFFGPLLPIIDILLQLLRVLIRDVFVRVSNPELFQVPGNAIPSQVGRAEAPEGVKPFDVEFMQRVSKDVALSERQAAIGLKQKAGCTISDKRFQECRESCRNVDGTNSVLRFWSLLLTVPDALADVDCLAVG